MCVCVYIYIYIYVYILYCTYTISKLCGKQNGASFEAETSRRGSQGFQGCGFHPSTNHFELLRLTYGLIIFVFLFLRIGAP